jgi:hypothetical protein
MFSQRARTLVLSVIVVIWAVNFFAALFVDSYEPDPAINAVFTTIVGSALVLRAKNGNGSDHG